MLKGKDWREILVTFLLETYFNQVRYVTPFSAPDPGKDTAPLLNRATPKEEERGVGEVKSSTSIAYVAVVWWGRHQCLNGRD